MTCPLVNPASGYRIFSRFVSLRVRSSILTSTAVSLATFAHHLARRRAGAQPLERGRSKLSGAGPFHELELCHEPRLYVVGISRGRAGVERAFVLRQRHHQGGQLLEHRIRETCSDLSRVYELALVVVAHKQGAWITTAPALARRPSGDNEILAVVVLDL